MIRYVLPLLLIAVAAPCYGTARDRTYRSRRLAAVHADGGRDPGASEGRRRDLPRRRFFRTVRAADMRRLAV
jgi:hypothetical protein